MDKELKDNNDHTHTGYNVGIFLIGFPIIYILGFLAFIFIWWGDTPWEENERNFETHIEQLCEEKTDNEADYDFCLKEFDF